MTTETPDDGDADRVGSLTPVGDPVIKRASGCRCVAIALMNPTPKFVAIGAVP